ncbi:BrnT family toxin [Sphingomonas populi]|uniref:BrnT family toxin n=1 Tax=Sphingomonas populi TaxID=2484750 RepID=A0A4Q6Y245_9SPHN|nr:BrnT family toxin [Sphingomonas populi]RZF64292.1 BrnT family toxin [Sphingomonas populi]
MEIEFDPAKDAANIAKHGVSLQAAIGFDWDTAFEREDDRFDYGEVRFVAIGLIGDRLHVLVFTEGSDDDSIRAISLRPAEKHEVRFYHGHV